MIAARPSIAALAGREAGLLCPARPGRSWPIAALRFRRRRAWSSLPTTGRPRSSPPRCASTFVGHSTWLIESAGAVRIATDYND